LLATATDFAERFPETRIAWEVRSLQQFGDASVKALAEQYDFIVIDHPFMGEVARDRCLLPLDEYVPHQTLQTLKRESVGPSHASYFYDGHQWALAIDAAAQVAGYRADLLDEAGVRVPETWDDVLEIAKIRRGFVTPALLPLDSLMCFFTLCANLGYPPFAESSARVVNHDAGRAALERLKDLANNSGNDAFAANPIAIWERMSTTDEIAYCPLAFGYSNYARNGYRRLPLSFANIPSSGFAGCSGATLGGAGLAITTRCVHIDAAVRYATWVAGANWQRTVYVQSGGQPGNLRAWTDPEANALTNGFFENTLPTLEKAYMRPRFPGFPDFQAAAWDVIWRFLQGGETPEAVLNTIDSLYQNCSVV
jgi:multiple sugar transport system substrate-binding protein